MAPNPTPRSRLSSGNFDLVARFYPALEWLVFQGQLNQARQAFIDVVLQANRVLLVGEGNGRFLESLMTGKRSGYIKVVEMSPVMIRLARDRLVPSDVVLEFLEADIRECQPGKGFDCVVTHLFLDQFNPPTQLALIQKIAELALEKGTWINVDFLPPRTLRGRLLMWLQYTFFRIASRIEAKHCFDQSPAAAQSGWKTTEVIPYLGRLVAAKRYQK
jgi:ubiquinone/menaquinone biosynthesis C-methylase UbiE